GLGHGHEASLAARASVEVFQRSMDASPKVVIEKSHAALSGTRGAAVATGRLLPTDNQFSFAGVGNIGATLISSSGSRGLMSHNGTVGIRMRTVQELEYEWPPGAFLVMHSDGLQSRWDLVNYPGLVNRHAATIAAVLLRDFIRGRDDTTVVVIRRS
ncbi:MAG TPA: SpoIIE family protein phosphatase, partial [Pirellula sp.]|nr:SpoIIE family protein phosphatase [Pirellula sp.]